MSDLMAKLLTRAERVVELAFYDGELTPEEEGELRVAAVDCAAYVKFKIKLENSGKSDEPNA